MEPPNQDQQEYWSASPSGQKWLTYEDQLDAAMAPILDLVIDRAALQHGDRVLDIGCGTGASLIAAARQVGPNGRVLGLDISQPFLDRAAERAKTAGFTHIETRCADAQTASFTDPPFDALISRFGVMFFADPQAAFANMARTLRPAARMTFAAWSGLAQNPWFRLPAEAAQRILGPSPPAEPDAPGPLGFQNAERVQRLLRAAGLKNVRCETLQIAMTPQGTAEEVAQLCLRVGPVSRLMSLHNGTPSDAQTILTDLADQLAAFKTAQGLMVPAEIHLFQANAD